MEKHEVIYQVRTALEVVAAGGVSSGGKIGEGFGKSATSRSFVQEWERANRMLEAIISMPACHNMALMARAQDGSMKFLHGVFAELVSMLWNGSDVRVQKYGKPAVEYLVRRWLVGAGSYREFGDEFGVCHSTASLFCKQFVGGVLEDWLSAACGVLEPVCMQFAEDVQIAA